MSFDRVRQYGIALANWRSTIGFLMQRDFNRRFEGSVLGTIFALGEPILLILVVLVFHGVFYNKIPMYGTSVALFISSGMLPFYLFLRLSGRVRISASYNSRQRPPRIGSSDLILATILTETTIMLAMMIVWFFGLWVVGIPQAEPASGLVCGLPLCLLIAFGVGIGLINATISRYFPLWNYIYGLKSRGLLILAGVFFVTDLLPFQLRSILVWSPLIHGVEWFRLGLYGTYPVFTLDREYLLTCALVTLFIGVTAHRATLRAERKLR
jgi:capsular polysaccharide transport system permease protein